jgi:hypothetical protein
MTKAEKDSLAAPSDASLAVARELLSIPLAMSDLAKMIELQTKQLEGINDTLMSLVRHLTRPTPLFPTGTSSLQGHPFPEVSDPHATVARNFFLNEQHELPRVKKSSKRK